MEPNSQISTGYEIVIHVLCLSYNAGALHSLVLLLQYVYDRVNYAHVC